MRLYIASEKKAIADSKKYNQNTAIISITEPNQEDVVFAENPFIKALFRMKFYDIEREYGKVKPAQQSDFKGLKEFVDSLSELNIKQLVVHCAAGISRSAAVAAAINEYANLGKHIWDCPSYFPNGHVYKLACRELGIGRTQEDYETLFGVRDEMSEYSG